MGLNACPSCTEGEIVLMTIVLVLFLAQVARPAMAVSCPLPAVKEFLSANVDARRTIMKRVDVCATAVPEATFTLIEAGLSDADQQVRLTAAASVRTLRSAITRLRVDPRFARTVEPPNSFLNVLAQTIDSADPEVRHQSVESLVELDPNKSRTKARLLARYNLEDASLLRANLLMHLREMAPNDASIRQVVLAALDDPSNDVRQQGVYGARLWTPDAALAAVGAGLNATDLGVRMACVDALAAYGARAKAFVGQLQQLLAAETNARRRRQIEAAISAITRS